MKQLPVYAKILPRLDNQRVWIACSGGLDSVFAATYLNHTRSIGLAYFNHGTEHAHEAEQFVRTLAANNRWPCTFGTISLARPRGLSAEEHWRNERYRFLNELGPAVVTGHHLGDAVETWVWSSCHGKPTLPHLHINNVYRPFLACKKSAMQAYLERRNVQWIEDPSNLDPAYTRNHIRLNVLPTLYKVNPGLDTVIQKKIEAAVTLEMIKQTS